MKQLSAILGTAVLVLSAVSAGQVRADYLNWTYTATVNTSAVTVGALSTSGGAAVALTDFTTSLPGGTSIPVEAYLTSTSNAMPVNFGPSTDTPSSFNLALKITDGNGQSGTLNFTGSLNGSMTATTSSVVASFVPVTTNSITFDGHTYSVTIPSLTLVPPTSPQQDIMASVSATNAQSGGSNPPPPPPHTNGTPEPTSLLLAGLGLSCFGAERWWRRRRLTQTIAAA